MENTGEQLSTAFRRKALLLLWIPNNDEQGRTIYWRKGWDSNPRYPCRHAGFQDRCLKPLGHPSKPIESSSYLGDARGRRWPLLPLCQPTLLVGLFMAACSASSTCAGASAAFRVVHPR